MSFRIRLLPRRVFRSRRQAMKAGEQKGTVLIVVARCLVCGKPVCLDRVI